LTAERERLRAAGPDAPWRKWGPYLSERHWGTVREDYSANGTAWDDFPFDHAASRAYQWGEDGLAGYCDENQLLCLSLALWNGRDPILKERMFGLANDEGNHGEDCKDYYFYLDGTPTHAYMKMLYKYPQAAFPYDELRRVNRERSRAEPEYELIDTGIFNDGRYFDVFVEYAKATPEETLVLITVHNRGPERAELDVLPQLWFRNTWWRGGDEPRPQVWAPADAGASARIDAQHAVLGTYSLAGEAAPELLFTENETNAYKLWGGDNPTFFVKDGFHEYVVNGRRDLVNPQRRGTKAALRYHLALEPGVSAAVRLRFGPGVRTIGDDFADIVTQRRAEADEFYALLTARAPDADHALVMRMGFAGMLWSKQTYIYDLYAWLNDRHSNPVLGEAGTARNREWYHMMNSDVISMPDKWEYPWYAAWDLAFHTLALGALDPEFTWDQIDLMLTERYMHPNGQIPAYEWNFSDVNPPVHAWAVLFNYWFDRRRLGPEAMVRLKRAFGKLALNFTWWTNRKDRFGKNLFEGGFLGLDNVGVFDRSAPLPTGGYLEQADGTAWMALFSQNMLQMALEIAREDAAYDELATSYYQHFIWIASALTRSSPGHVGMWDEEDGFFYDVLRRPDGTGEQLKVRSVVGLLPLCAVTIYDADIAQHAPLFLERARWFNAHRPDLTANLNAVGQTGEYGRVMLAVLNEERLRRVLARMLDPNEFLSDYGIRSLSRYHLEHPYVLVADGKEYRVGYLPSESDSGTFGGNSNWRGPVWMPINALIVRALVTMYGYYGDRFRIECPTGSGTMLTLYEVAKELVDRLSSIFTRNGNGRRPVFGGAELFQNDPHWRDHVLFYEYFHGDNGAGIGASHQTGWTGLISGLMNLFDTMSADDALRHGKDALTRRE
jgi:hypothetical protein